MHKNDPFELLLFTFAIAMTAVSFWFVPQMEKYTQCNKPHNSICTKPHIVGSLITDSPVIKISIEYLDGSTEVHMPQGIEIEDPLQEAPTEPSYNTMIGYEALINI